MKYKNRTCKGTARYGGVQGCKTEGKVDNDVRACNISKGINLGLLAFIVIIYAVFLRNDQ